MPAPAAYAAPALLNGPEGWRGGPPRTASQEPGERAVPIGLELRRTPARRFRLAAMDLFDFFRDWDLEQQW